MVRVAGLSAADETGLFGYKAQVLLVPQPFGFGEGKHALVDAGRELVLCQCRIKFAARDVTLIEHPLEPDEPGLKGLPDLVPIRGCKGVCHWPCA